MQKDKGFWIGLSLINLTVIALFGLLMRSKVIFSIPFLDYRNLLYAHSYFALSGWVGLALLALLVYDVLPAHLSQKKRYRLLLWSIQTGAAGMGLSFPFLGYHALSAFFVLVYYAATVVFGWIFLKDVKKAVLPAPVCWMSLGAVASLLLSSLGPLGISYIMLSGSGNSLLYRDLAYSFLHLQYNGFFTPAIFALFFSWCTHKGIALPPAAKPFSTFLLFSVLPSLFLSLLWHNLVIFYLLAAIGSLLILISVGYFVPVFRNHLQHHLFRHPLAKIFWIASFISFVIKMVLTTGTLYPGLGNAVYAARPIIIGFMHLVFLAFASFFILSLCIEQGFFRRRRGIVRYPFYIFGAGVVVTELLLLIQGAAVLLQTNHPFYNKGLWVGAILLFSGACTLMTTFYRTRKRDSEIVGK